MKVINSLIHEGFFNHPNELAHSAATALIIEFRQDQEQEHNVQELEQVIPSCLSKWMAPPYGWF
jgi:hypothetical protein